MIGWLAEGLNHWRLLSTIQSVGSIVIRAAGGTPGKIPDFLRLFPELEVLTQPQTLDEQAESFLRSVEELDR